MSALTLDLLLWSFFSCGPSWPWTVSLMTGSWNASDLQGPWSASTMGTVLADIEKCLSPKKIFTLEIFFLFSQLSINFFFERGRGGGIMDTGKSQGPPD